MERPRLLLFRQNEFAGSGDAQAILLPAVQENCFAATFEQFVDPVPDATPCRLIGVWYCCCGDGFASRLPQSGTCDLFFWRHSLNQRYVAGNGHIFLCPSVKIQALDGLLLQLMTIGIGMNVRTGSGVLQLQGGEGADGKLCAHRRLGTIERKF